MASRVKEGIKELFSSKDDLDYPDTYLNQRRFQTLSGRNMTLPVIELSVPMCCEKCQEKVKEELEELEGVQNIICDQYNQRVTVTGFADPLKVLRKVKKVKKKSAFFNDSTYISATSHPIVSSHTNNLPLSTNNLPMSTNNLPMSTKNINSSGNGFTESRHTNNSATSIKHINSSGNGFSESRYTANPLVRANSSGFGRFPHEGQMSPMMRAPVVQQVPVVPQAPVVLRQVQQPLHSGSMRHGADVRPVEVYPPVQRVSHSGSMRYGADARPVKAYSPVVDVIQRVPHSGSMRYGAEARHMNAYAPVDIEREYYGIRRMPSFKNHRYHDAEYISMGNEFQPAMTESHYVPHHNQRPALLRPQISFSQLPVTNPDYMKHMESEYD